MAGQPLSPALAQMLANHPELLQRGAIQATQLSNQQNAQGYQSLDQIGQGILQAMGMYGNMQDQKRDDARTATQDKAKATQQLADEDYRDKQYELEKRKVSSMEKTADQRILNMAGELGLNAAQTTRLTEMLDPEKAALQATTEGTKARTKATLGGEQRAEEMQPGAVETQKLGIQLGGFERDKKKAESVYNEVNARTEQRTNQAKLEAIKANTELAKIQTLTAGQPAPADPSKWLEATNKHISTVASSLDIRLDNARRRIIDMDKIEGFMASDAGIKQLDIIENEIDDLIDQLGAMDQLRIDLASGDITTAWDAWQKFSFDVGTSGEGVLPGEGGGVDSTADIFNAGGARE